MRNYALLILALTLSACGGPIDESAEGHGSDPAAVVVKGPHNGRLLADGPFAIELAIFETGIPPEFHAWPTLDGKPVPLDQVDLTVQLTRLNKSEEFRFAPQADYLRADHVVREPHSFIVKVAAAHAGKTHEWSYESFEGRTTIASDIAEAAGVKTEAAGSAQLVQTLTLYGRIVPDPAHERQVSARYPGSIHAVSKKLGDRVAAGETLARIESNESLQIYTVTAPISGIVTARSANPGEQSGDRALFTIMDPSSVWAELSVFPRDRAKVRPGAAVRVKSADSDVVVEGKVDRVDVLAGANQAVTARVTLKNPNNEFVSGGFVTAEVAVAERTVPLAVKTSGLQPFRDFTVVYEQVGDTYEVRMLELGEQHGEWVEILGGLDPGARYVTENSYVIKADVEKSGASHDH
ncbi:MAG TPA: efflux RND transporter periplasmic adaptor subunit [Steroidobacteraceae bacterium]|nr:efflux RND transporter periplasmic adaptor subunit [Steroidobacteraceae bacterium]